MHQEFTSGYSGTVTLKAIGSFHIGGRSLEIQGQPCKEIALTQGVPHYLYDPNGTFQIEQAYIQYFLPAVQRFETPVLLIHGGGFTGAVWETTPDGRPGWLWRFLEAGIAVYVIDNVERGRAGWCSLPAIWPDEPLLRSEEEAWTLYRFGLAQDYAIRRPFPGQRFPISHITALTSQTVPRWPSTGLAALAALEAAIDCIGPCVLVGHSQGGGIALRAALQLPELVTAVIAIEPTGLPEMIDPGSVNGRPFIFVMGDYIEHVALFRETAAKIQLVVQKLEEAGALVEELDLPSRGMQGNSHMLMMDNNSDQIAALLISWLDRYSTKKKLR